MLSNFQVEYLAPKVLPKVLLGVFPEKYLIKDILFEGFMTITLKRSLLCAKM